ncbi:MAG: cupredoxin family copper-binding protein [Proteobacteria bacterium]|nr:cupredoxin family copper-binding protein [Pseudomonadota bacterium]
MYEFTTRLAATPARVAAILVTTFSIAFATPSLLATPTPATPTIDITKFTYAPKEITVAPGTRIVWTNRDEVPHTVTAKDKSVDSKAMDTGDKFEYTFTQEGDFEYFCVVHPFMTGVVHVRKQ